MAGDRPKLTVVVAGRNSPILEQSLKSVACQEYQDYNVVLLDDNSDEQAKNISLAKQVLGDRLASVVLSTSRVGKSALYRRALALIDPRRFVVNVDADDFLVSDRALSVIAACVEKGAWFVFGRHLDLQDRSATPSDSTGFIKLMLTRRGSEWFDHPHCAYAAVLAAIPDERLKYCGEYAQTCQDRFLFRQAMELAGPSRSVCTEQVIYRYRYPTPSNVRYQRAKLQADTLRFFSSQPMLHPLGADYMERLGNGP